MATQYDIAAPKAMPRRKTWLTLRHREWIMAYGFLLPTFVLFFVFVIYPPLRSIYLSFRNFEFLRQETDKFIGLANYAEVFTDPLAWHGLKIAAYSMLLSIPQTFPYAMLIAFALYKTKRGKSFFRAAIYLPAVIGGPIVAIIWLWILNPTYGIFNAFINQLGLPSQNWFGDPKWALPMLVFMGIPGVGGGVLYYLVALNSVNPDVYEAAYVEGANQFKVFTRITVPLIMPYLTVQVVLFTIGNIQAFVGSIMVTGGGPGRATYTYMYHAWRLALSYPPFRWGYVSAMIWLLGIFIAILAFIQLRLMRSEKL